MGVRRVLTGLAVPGVLLLLAAGCTSDGGKSVSAAPIRIGFIADMSGNQKGIGRSMRDGLDLYLKLHGGRLGGRRVQVVQRDAGDDPTSSKAAKAEQGLLNQRGLLAITGISDVRTVLAMQKPVTERKLPLVSTLACTDQVPDLTYLWCASNLTSDPPEALGAYVAQHAGGRVYVLGTDLGPAKGDTTQTFVRTFKAAGGKLANPSGQPTYAPYSDKASYRSYLTEAQQNGAKAIYVWATGMQAVQFVKEYQKLDLKSQGIKVYASGPLTCCDLLQVEGSAALGIYSSLDYTPTLDNDANREFVVAYQHAYGTAPNEPAAYGYSAASILDQAISSVTADGRALTGKAVNTAIANLGIQNDPRGSWQFSKKHAPVQKFYLRQVRMDGSVLSNVLVNELPTIGE